MTQQEIAQAEEEVQDALPPDTEETEPPGDGEEPVEEPDYKALLETSEAERTKLLNDQKARDGRMKPFTEALQPLKDEVEAMKKTNNVFFESFVSGETDGLLQKVDKINTEAQRAAQKTAFGRQYTVLLEKLHQSVLDGDSKPIFDIVKDPAFLDVRTAWNKAYDAGDLAGLHAAQNVVHVRVIAEERKLRTTEVADAKKMAKVSKQKALSDAQVLDVDTGSGGVSPEEPAWRKLSPTGKIQHALDKASEKE